MKEIDDILDDGNESYTVIRVLASDLALLASSMDGKRAADPLDCVKSTDFMAVSG